MYIVHRNTAYKEIRREGDTKSGNSLFLFGLHSKRVMMKNKKQQLCAESGIKIILYKIPRAYTHIHKYIYIQ